MNGAEQRATGHSNLDAHEAEEAQRKTEARLRQIQEAARIGTFEFDRITNRVSASPEYLELYGLSPAALDGFDYEAWLTLVHPDDRDQIAAKTRAAVNDPSCRQLDYEFRIRRVDTGETRWITARTKLERDGAGHFARSLGAQWDVTDERTTLAALQESEGRFRNMADHAPVMTWMTDSAGYCTYLNRRWYDFTGQTPEQAEGFGRLDATHPDDKARAEQIFLAANARREAFRLEYRLRRADGTYRWAMDAASPRFGPGGEFLGYVGSVIDIDERREAENRLASSEERFRQLAETINEVFYVTDLAARRLLYVSPAYEPIWGRSAAALIEGRELFLDTIHPEDRGRIAAMAPRQARGEALDREYRIVRPDGTIRFIRDRSYPVQKGAADRTVGIAEDITARKQADARFRGVFNSDLTGFSIFDAESGETLAINDRFLAMTGHMRADFEEGRWDWREFTLPEHVHKDRRAVAQARERGWWDAYEKEYRHRDGSVFPIRIASAPLPGEPGRVVVSIEDISERQAAEVALRASEQRFRLLADAMPQLVWTAGPDGQVDYYNARRQEYAGASAPEDGHWDWAPILHPDDLEQTRQAWANSASTGEDYACEHRLARGDGSWAWHVSRATAERGPDGSVLKWYGTATDIDHLKATQAALQALNEGLEQTIANRTEERDRIWRLSRDLMCVARTDGTLLSLNPAWERLLGWPLDWLTGRDASEIKHPDDAERTRQELNQLAAGRSTRGFEDRYRHRDGSWRWISWTIEPEGELIYCVGRDVTAEKQRQEELEAAEAARRQADALYRAYFENTAEALFVVNVLEDGGFTVEDLNPAHQASIGLPLAEVYGRRIDEILPPDLAEAVEAHYRRVLAACEVYQYRETFELNGKSTYWDTVLVPVRGSDGRIVRLIGSSRDLTRQLETEEQLRQAQKMESMGQLTGGVAHDFNNLLTPIIGSLDMLRRRGIGSEREQRMVSGALESAERAKTLVQRLLAFARRQPLQPVAVDLGQLIHGMAGLIGSTLGPKIEVRVEIADDLPPVRADANQIEMALLNLAVNARDAMPEGGVLTFSIQRESVRPGHRAELKRGHYVRVSVVDTGIGMDEATLKRAVEPFFSTKGIGKGTGLGLSMVHGLVAQLGGALNIASAPGLGTTVELWLAVASALPGPDAAKATRLSNIKALGKALVVDDEDLVRMSTADMLIDLGYEVVEAGSAEEALRLIRQGEAADLLVTDHLMPGMNGAELAREARKLRPGLPVLIVSGYAEVDGIAPDLPRLTKPFRNSDLAASVAEVFAHAAAGPK